MKCQLPDCERDAYPGQDFCSGDHRDRADRAARKKQEAKE